MAGGLVLSSPLRGVLVAGDGSGVPGVTVVRRWEWGWNGRTGEEVTVTDGEGRFEFGTVTGRSLSARIAPHEPSIRIQLVAQTPEGPRLLLSMNKSSYSLGSEARTVGQLGPVLLVRCRADSEPTDEGLYWGTCVSGE